MAEPDPSRREWPEHVGKYMQHAFTRWLTDNKTTAAKVAVLIDVSPAKLSHVRNGEPIGTSVLKKLARCMGTDIFSIAREADEWYLRNHSGPPPELALDVLRTNFDIEAPTPIESARMFAVANGIPKDFVRAWKPPPGDYTPETLYAIPEGRPRPAEPAGTHEAEAEEAPHPQAQAEAEGVGPAVRHVPWGRMLRG